VNPSHGTRTDSKHKGLATLEEAEDETGSKAQLKLKGKLAEVDEFGDEGPKKGAASSRECALTWALSQGLRVLGAAKGDLSSR